MCYNEVFCYSVNKAMKKKMHYDFMEQQQHSATTLSPHSGAIA